MESKPLPESAEALKHLEPDQSVYQWNQADIVQKRTRPLIYLIFCLSVSVYTSLLCTVNTNFVTVKTINLASSVAYLRRS